MRSQAQARRPQILLVEDNAADIDVIREALRELNVEGDLHIARDGQNAIEWIRAFDALTDDHQLDLLILDLHLPRHDGAEVLSHIRRSRRLSHTAVLVMSAWKAGHLEGAEQGLLYRLRKPSTMEELDGLRELIEKILIDETGRQVPGGGQSTPS